MNRLPISRVQVGDDLYRYRVQYESDPCSPGTQHARFFQFEMLKTIALDPQISACGLSDFQTLKMHHDGGKWIIALEATVTEKPKL